MRITKIQVKNFKRFTDLTIQYIPDTSKLVLLIGSNGSGKSSVFDAFGYINNVLKGDAKPNGDYQSYFKKNKNESLKVDIELDNTAYSFTDMQSDKTDLPLHAFYGRTSFRQISRLVRTALGQGESVDFERDTDRAKFFIDRDNRFENDLEKITEVILKDLFRLDKSGQEIREQYVDPINRALARIFDAQNGTKLQLIEIIPPLDGKTSQITFRKGVSEFHYNYLSAGEKEIFNILINLLSRAPLYQDTIYYFDEIDLHLNTQLQFNLLKEITENWIPENCQLWTASHSLGFIEYAKQAAHASIIDFDNLDFDLPRILYPEPKDNPDIYEIAVGKDFATSLFKQMDIYFVENKDRNYYATVEIPRAIFISDNNRNTVFHKSRAANFKGIVDRDFLSDSDVIQIRKHYKNLRVLNYYSIENYMYHPDNLEEYYASKGKPYDKKNYVDALIIAKNEVKNRLLLGIGLDRLSYPYFGEPDFNGQPLQKRFKNEKENREECEAIQVFLSSDELEVFYKFLPMKTYCTNLVQRQHIPKSELVKTAWFKAQIEGVLNVKKKAK